MDRFLEDLILTERGKGDERPLDDEPTFGLHHPFWYVLDTWLAYRNHGILPEAGGFNDQDPLLVIDDWGVMNARYTYLSHSVKDMDNLPFKLPDSADDWQSL